MPGGISEADLLPKAVCWRGRDLQISPETKLLVGTIPFPSPSLDSQTFAGVGANLSIYLASTVPHSNVPL